ncbi:alpha/beta hydrolase-fold protein [Yeosuana sp. MJ-SS3]|uniref:Alpha/beta hydrolase-fold protein n=1 Tax=Gilvirhabdus luticola TaxID=3079858 RepID=A0ABU3U7W8_9FLAO|nr:alpha/beta hydrolase-fold protein [Yeosuana sp. MJ-SS3]MDU8886507.1 alpha/beta hydrolase-fold protein [Yeosuana sp. MJ-SS3]
MKKKLILIVLLTTIMSFCGCEHDIIETNTQESEQLIQQKSSIIHKSKLQNKEFTSESLMYNVIGNDPIRKMQVYTPPGYDHKRAEGYPVVYLLHGEPFSEKAFIDRRAWDEFAASQNILSPERDDPPEGFRLWADNLIETGKMEPMIIVMPNAISYPYGFSMYSNSILNGNFEDYIVNDLVNFMDKRYNTIASNNGRAVIGYSQGGYAAFKFGLKHPDIFGAVASHSGLLLVDAVLSMGEVIIAENPNGFIGPDPDKFLTSAGYAFSAAWSPNLNNPPFYVDLPFEYPSPIPIPEVSERWYQNDVFTLLDTHFNEFKSLKGIYFDVGIYDELGMNLAYPYLIQKMDAYSIDYTYETFEGGHFNKTFSRLAVSLQFCSDALSK